MSQTEHCYLGARDGCLAFLRGKERYYVYLLRRPDRRPFYVGKGKGQRVFDHENEARHPNDRSSNSHKLNVIRSIWRQDKSPIYEIRTFFGVETEAYDYETRLIQELGRLHEGGILTNRAPGGGSTAGPSPFSKEKHSKTLGGFPENDPETETLNRFVLAIATMKSVVLKPRSRFKPRPTQPYPTKSMGKTQRQAVALAASAASNGIILDGEVLVPRTVTIDGIEGFVENGVSCDLVTSGMASLIPSNDPSGELFRLSPEQARAVVGLIGFRVASDLGIVESSISKVFE